MSGRELPPRLPEEWRERWGQRLGVELPSTFVDDPAELPPVPRRAAIARRNRSVAERLMNNIEPLWDEALPVLETREAGAR